MKRFLLTLLSIFIISLNTSAEEQPLIKIGATLPLSGSLADIGKDIQRGLELAKEENAKKGIKFELIYEDNRHENKYAAATAQKLISQDHADIVLSLWDMADIVAPITEKYKVPHLSIRWNPHVAEEYEYTFTVESTYESYIESMVELIKHQGAKSIGIFTEESKGWILAADYLKEIAPKNGIEVVAEEVHLTKERDHRSIVVRLLKKKPDMVVLLNHSPNTETIIGKIKELSPGQKFTGYFEALSERTVIEGVPFAAQFAAADWFKEKFKKKYSEPFLARAPQAYDIVNMLVSAQKGHKELVEGKELIKELTLISNVKGASGTLNANNSRTIESDCVWKVARNGKFEIYN